MDVRFALSGSGNDRDVKTFDRSLPSAALLIAYPIAGKSTETVLPRISYRDWSLDSGAFSVERSGARIDLQGYIDDVKRWRDGPHPPCEVFALDVIGDWRASLRNTEEMWKHGIEAIPCFHVGEPESVLLGLARDYPKIALGGAVGYRDKVEWARQCFARIWPKRIHGFGYGAPSGLRAVPWDSVDATSWFTNPTVGNRWHGYNRPGKGDARRGDRLVVRHRKDSPHSYNYRVEIDYYLQLEREMNFLWRREMETLASLPR